MKWRLSIFGVALARASAERNLRSGFPYCCYLESRPVGSTRLCGGSYCRRAGSIGSCFPPTTFVILSNQKCQLYQFFRPIFQAIFQVVPRVISMVISRAFSKAIPRAFPKAFPGLFPRHFPGSFPGNPKSQAQCFFQKCVLSDACCRLGKIPCASVGLWNLNEAQRILQNQHPAALRGTSASRPCPWLFYRPASES